MAEEGERNVLNTRKRKSTEPISDSITEKESDEDGTNGPPPEKLLKPIGEAISTKGEQQSIPTGISSENSNTESKVDSHNEEKESLASIGAENEILVNSNDSISEGIENHNDIEITSNAAMNESKSRSTEHDTIDNLYVKEDDDQSNATIVKESAHIHDLSDNTNDFMREVDRVFEDGLIILDETESTPIPKCDERKPIVTISFASKEVFENYGHEFFEFCRKYSEFRASQDAIKLSINLVQGHSADNFDSTEWQSSNQYDANDDSLANNQQNCKKKQSKAKKELFTLDANPSNNVTGTRCQYSSKFAALSNEPKVEGEIKSGKKYSSATCFNCDGAHALRDCPLPRNHQKINKARGGFQKKFFQTSRYHDDDEQRYSYLTPGTISLALRTALGLRDNQIPPYVYRMRIFGYPPGWIEEATEHGSSMAVFGMDGKVEDTGKGGSRFNASRMMQYAGFNVKMEKGMRDEYEKNNVPPFTKEHSTEAMLNYIRKIESTLNDNKEICDMDVDKEEEGNDEDEEVVVEVPPPGCEDECSSNDTKTSLGDLETQKQQLLAELNENSQSQDIEQVLNDRQPSSIQNTTLEVNTTLETKTSGPEEHSTPSNKLKVSEFGTPIIKSASPYSHLPNAENFSVGVSDVINYENLPNSTGAYEKITGLITKVRETLKSRQDSSST